jgi:hypothetical protein
MSYHGEAYKAAQIENEEARKKMIENNHRQMEALAKEKPVPTIEDIQKATAPRKPREEVKDEATKTGEATKTDDADDDANKAKTSTASSADSSKAGYNTRASTAKK